MFAVLVPGRFVQPADQIAATQFSLSLPEVAALNHVAVFLTGAIAFPEGFGATIHIQFPEKPWQCIGALSNAKPSAIFRLRGTINPSTTVSPFASYAPAANSLGTSNLVANLGISIEPLEAVEAQVNALAASSSSTQLVVHKPALDPVELAARIAQNLFNFVSSGVELPGDLLRKWLEIFQGKLKTRGVAFLQSD